MNITVRFFALHRDIVGASKIVREVPQGTTLGQLWTRLCEEYPALAPATRSLMFARNQEYAAPGMELHDGDEVAFIPPVSGGEAIEPFLVTDRPLDPQPLTGLVQTPQDGAIVVFSGVARDNFGGRPTAHLEYEAYPEMAVPVLRQLAAEAQERFAIGRVAVHHRIGALEIGQTAVIVAVAAPHRHAAFEAAAHIMDRIKEVAPIWKREHWADGDAEWVGDEWERKGRLEARD